MSQPGHTDIFNSAIYFPHNVNIYFKKIYLGTNYTWWTWKKWEYLWFLQQGRKIHSNQENDGMSDFTFSHQPFSLNESGSAKVSQAQKLPGCEFYSSYLKILGLICDKGHNTWEITKPFSALRDDDVLATEVVLIWVNSGPRITSSVVNGFFSPNPGA